MTATWTGRWMPSSAVSFGTGAVRSQSASPILTAGITAFARATSYLPELDSSKILSSRFVT